jgi:hypothetical protein
MSLMERIFGSIKPTQTQSAQQSASNNPALNPPPQIQQTAQTDANGVIPKDGDKPPVKETTEASPGAKFKDLWNTPEPDKSQTPPPQVQPNTPAKSMEEQMMEAAAKVDFSKVLSREELTKVSAGGQEAVEALVGLLNKTAQTVYGQSIGVANKLIDRRIDEARTEFQSQIPDAVKRVSARETLFSENPAFANPAVAPIVSAIQQQLAEKYPKASGAELNKMAKEYLEEAAGVFNPTAVKPSATNTPNQKQATKDENWDEWIKL